MRSDIERWNRKYGERPPSASIDPDPLLLRHRGLLGNRGLGIDIAGGTGDNGLYLCRLGYRTVVVDGSEVGLRLCRRKAVHNALDPMLVVADLDRFTLPKRRFDAVLIFRYLNRALVGPVLDSLEEDGVLFFKTFNSRHLIRHPGFPREYLLEDGELTKWFSGLRCVDTNDGDPADTTYHWVGHKG